MNVLKKLKGRKKGRQKTPSIRDLRRKALLNQAVSSIPAKTVEQKKVSNDLLAKASQTSLVEAPRTTSSSKRSSKSETSGRSIRGKKICFRKSKIRS
jgi:hypothetical protein